MAREDPVEQQERYERPEMKVIRFTLEDVMTVISSGHEEKLDEALMGCPPGNP